MEHATENATSRHANLIRVTVFPTITALLNVLTHRREMENVTLNAIPNPATGMMETVTIYLNVIVT